ncbi:MAG TPA: hypothetical protein VEA78_05770 [Acidimicrobiales bacterium]|nr:hypothetical protein [Acidimicrobiales bacterium]
MRRFLVVLALVLVSIPAVNAGEARFHGSLGATRLNSPIVGMASTPSGDGYWLVAADGGVFTFGDAEFFGSAGATGVRDVVGIARTPSGDGYWIATSSGRVYAYGDAPHRGDGAGGVVEILRRGNDSTYTLVRGDGGVVGAAARSAGGHWTVTTDGRVGGVGGAPHHGDLAGVRLNQPIVGMAGAPGGTGYWLVAADGGIFSFGTAPFYGSTGHIRLNQRIVGMASSPGGGYWFVAADGGIFTFNPGTTPSSAPPTSGGCAMFPSDNPWNTDISGHPVHTRSDAWVNSIGRDDHLHPDFGTFWDGGPIGIPYVEVGAGQSRVDVTFDYDDESDHGTYPIPSNAPIEGGSSSDGDRHVLVLHTAECKLYELFAAYPQADGSWHAGSGAIFDLRSNALRPDGWTSADAAGLPILPGLVRYDEVAAGAINHALRFTVSTSQRGYIHPATHFASSNTDANVPPMGARFRMKASYDCSWASREVQVICAAMKRYGMFVADNGSDWYVSGAHDPRWDDGALGDLKQVPSSAFEAVETGPVRN